MTSKRGRTTDAHPSKRAPRSRSRALAPMPRTGSVLRGTGAPTDSLGRNQSGPVILAGLFVAVLLSIGGILLLRGNQVEAGAIAVVAGVGLFAYSSRNLGTMTWSKVETTRLVEEWLPIGMTSLGVACAALAAFEVSQPRLPGALWQSCIFWIMGLLAFAVGILWLEHWSFSLKSWIAWIRANYLESIAALSIVLVSLGLRLYALSYHPYPWSGDEATVGMEGVRLLSSQIPDVFNAGWSGNPFPAFYLTALAEAIYGSSILSVRIASAAVGTASVLFLYVAAREFFGRNIALISAAFLGTLPYHLQFSRVGVLTVQDSLVVTLVLWLVIRAVRKNQLRAYMYAGLASGLTVYAYVGGRLVLGLALCALFLVAITHRNYLRAQLKHLLVYMAGIFVALVPMGVFFLNHLQDFGSRFAQVSIVQSGWLARTSAQTGRSVLSLLADQFANSTLVFVASPAYGGFFNSPQPYLTLGAALLFLLGMGVAFQKISQVPYALLLIWFWSVVFFGGVLTLSPPANTRMIMTAPAIASFVAIGIAKLIEILTALQVPSRWLIAGIATLMSVLVVQGVVFYFGPYRAGKYFDDANAEVAMQAGLELRRLGGGYTFVMIGLPRMYSGFPTIVFLDPENPRVDIDPANAAATDLSRSLPAFVVATPDNLGPLEQVAARYPGGTWETIPSQSRNETLYYAYVLGKASAEVTP